MTTTRFPGAALVFKAVYPSYGGMETMVALALERNSPPPEKYRIMNNILSSSAFDHIVIWMFISFQMP